MAFPNKWSTFTCTIADVEKKCSFAHGVKSIDNLNDCIEIALLEVKTLLYSIVWNKFKAKGKTKKDLPNEGAEPDDKLDAIFDDAFPTIRHLVVLLTLREVFRGTRDDLSVSYNDEYDNFDKDVIYIWVDVDADNVLDDAEHINRQAQLNDRIH